MSRASKDQTKAAKLLDRLCCEILKEGGDPILDENGKPILDGDGKVIRHRPSAAWGNVIRGRLKDLGINAVPVAGSDAGNLAEEAARRGLRINGRAVSGSLPPLSDEDDAATA